ncbi:hypothetical protein [Streptomyces sp. NPDC088812]|uniref:hypothetical protein n=1 Tax=Streptomyces sp. NPDC088812 TaxID=3365905 RepID=UPI0037FF511A
MTNRAYPAERVARYIEALQGADDYAQLTDRRDVERLARAVMAVADDETDPVYRSGYRTGRIHAGSGGWVLNEFTPVVSLSDGTDRTVTELRHQPCGQLVQGVGPHNLIDLMALAAQHECQTTGEDGR